MNKISICILLLVLTLIFLVGCSENNSSQNTNNATTEVFETEVGYFKNDENVFEIKSPYCSLYYPTKWKDMVRTDVTTEANCVVKFTALINDTEYPLFDISFGDTKSEFFLGVLPTDKGKINIYMNDYSDELPEDLSEEAKDTLYAMIEDVNVIISELVYRSGMVTELN